MKRYGETKCMLLNERNQSEKATSYMILTIGHSRKGKTMGTIKRSVAARTQRKRGKNRQNAEDIQGSETVLRDAVMMDISHYTLGQAL